MNKNQIIDTFNKHFMDFIIDIERVFPNDTDIMSMRKSLNKSLYFFAISCLLLTNSSKRFN